MRAAVEHLGYVQIDTIHVVERCHHQILYTRIPQFGAFQKSEIAKWAPVVRASGARVD